MTLPRMLYGTLVLTLLLAAAATGQLSGTKTIGTGGDYATFADAIAALNTSGVAAPGVEFRILSGTYTEASPLTIDIAANKPDASAPVLFKPVEGATVTLNIGGQVTDTRWGLRIGTAANSVDYITLDGSNQTDGYTRDWTIKATATTWGIEPLDIYGDYVTVKNCVIDMISSGYSGSGYGISFRDVAPTATYGTVQNCKITGNNAVSIGRGTAADMPGFTIAVNEIHAYNRGIYAYRSSAITISGNEIVGDAHSAYPSGACYGIYTASPSGNTDLLTIENNTIRGFGRNGATASAQTVRGILANGPGTYIIAGNKVYDLANGTTGSGTPHVYGIQLSGGGQTSSYAVYNNFVAGLVDNDPDASASVYTYGIHYNTSGNAAIAYNTVVVDETDRDRPTAAIALAAGNSMNNMIVLNNIAINHNASPSYASYALFAATTTNVMSNNNDLFADGATNAFTGRWAGADHATLADWQTASGQDAASVSKAVTFTTATDLHLAGESIGDADLQGTMLPSISFDIDGDPRSGTAPYMGADENLDVPLPVQLAAFSALRVQDNVQLTWKTMSEVNNYGFFVERKLDGTAAFAEVPNSFVQGHATTLEPRDYSFTDNTVTPGVWYYRLRQVDLDGGVAYSEPVKVEILTDVATGQPAAYALNQNYPNPFNPSTDIQFSLAQAGSVTLKVYDMLGREVATLVSGERAAGVHTVSFDAANLPSGAYIYALRAGSFSAIRTMMLLK